MRWSVWEGNLIEELFLSLLTLGFYLFSALGEDCQAYLDLHSKVQSAKSCPSFCCGDCTRRYCCSNSLFRFDEEQQLMCNLLDGRYDANGACTVGSKDKSKHLNGKNLQRDLSAPYKALSGIYFKARNLLLKWEQWDRQIDAWTGMCFLEHFQTLLLLCFTFFWGWQN